MNKKKLISEMREIMEYNLVAHCSEHLGAWIGNIGKSATLCAEAALKHMPQWVKFAMPEYDGDYLCLIQRNNECGTTSTYQRVRECKMNKFVQNDLREEVIAWQCLPEPPKE